MQAIWARDDPQLGLSLGHYLEIAYPHNYLPLVENSQRGQMTTSDVDKIVSNVLEHPSLDLNFIFQDFRLTGYLPPNHINSIRQLFKDCQNDMMHLDKMIKDTISAISKLSRELTQASARMVQKVSQVRLCSYLLSSPSHLPQDILEEIFRACLATNTHPSPKSERAPLQLAAVCYRWRAVALSMPVLWNALYIRFPRHLELARIWLNRCYLPSITIDIDNTEVSPSQLQEFLDLLRGQSFVPRIIDVCELTKLNGPLRAVVNQFILERDHPALEEFVITGQDGLLVMPSFPGASTRIRRIYSQIYPKSWRTAYPPRQLTVLWLAPEIHHNTLTVFLANCPNLTSLYVKLNKTGYKYQPEPEVTRDITLHRLHYLGIWDGCGTDSIPDDLLERFTFPSLRILEYCLSLRSSLWLGLNHALKSVHRLTLQFHKRRPSSDSFVAFLEAATSVIEVTVSTKTNFMEDAIISLCLLSFPNLKTLYLGIDFGELTKWPFFQKHLGDLGLQWSTQFHPQGEFQVVVIHRYTDVDDNRELWEASDFRSILQATFPAWRVGIVSVWDVDWFWGVPVSFGMVPLPSNGAYTYEVFGEGDTWTEKQVLEDRMCSIWVQSEPGYKLTNGNLFDVFYPQDSLAYVEDLRRIQVTDVEVNQIASNIFEHHSLDLRSIFEHFRLSGSLPSSNIESVKTFLDECQNDIKSLEAKVKDTISTISQLSRELSETSARMVQKASQVRLSQFLLSSTSHHGTATHLPHDVLQEIFISCLETNEDPYPETNCAPLQLAAVCHRWRVIALSIPALWNSLSVQYPNHVDLAQTWLSRCDRPSLTINIRNYSFSPSKLRELLDLLNLSRSPRIVDVRWMSGGLGEVMKEFILDNDQLALEELVIRCEEGIEVPSLPKSSPLLRRFYSHIIPQTLRHSPPPSELTVLWLTEDVHHITLVSFLLNCPNLESLYLALGQNGLRVVPEPVVSNDVTLPQLHYFGIWELTEGECPPEDLLERFHFPSLRIAEYCNSRKTAPWLGFSHILQSVQRFTIQSREGNLPLEYCTRLLRNATSLVELTISIENQSMPNLMALLTSMTPPNVQTLYLDASYSKLAEWTSESLEPQLTAFGLAWSSKDRERPLRQLVIQHWRNTDEDDDEPEGDQDENKERHLEGLEVKKLVQSACPDLQVKIVSIIDTDWFWDVPVSFGMVPLPCNAVSSYEVLQDDGTWTAKSGPVYQIM